MRFLRAGLTVIGLACVVAVALASPPHFSGEQIHQMERQSLDAAEGLPGAFHYTPKVANGYNTATGVPDTLRTPGSGNYLIITDINFSWLRMENADTIHVAIYNGVSATDSVWHCSINANTQETFYSFTPAKAIVLSADSVMAIQCKSTSNGKGTTIPDTLFFNIYGHEILD